jgi:hypothetical protein
VTILRFGVYTCQVTKDIKMAKQYYIIVDTETTIKDTVADFAAVVCDKQGTIYAQCAVLVQGHFDTLELFHDKNKNDVWGYDGLIKRKEAYNLMLNNGQRMLASVHAVNRWLMQARLKYAPELTAYNLNFDLGKCRNTAIDLGIFERKFCLWHASVGNICQTRKYKQFILDNHGFNNRTEKGNLTYITNAEYVAGYIKGNYEKEPHEALGDIIGFELPILQAILKKRAWRDNIRAYNWQDTQVRDHFRVA